MATNLTPFSKRVARAVKAELARRDFDGVALTEPLGINRNAVYARLRYEQPFDLNQIEKIADFLGIELETLLDSAAIEVELPRAVA
jgi:hypothetical protein